MSARRVKVEMAEAHGSDDLDQIAALVREAAGSDALHACARDRRAPVLDGHRRIWMLRVDGALAGFLDAVLEDDRVLIDVFVTEVFRRRGVASGSVGRLLGMAPWPRARLYAATVHPRDVGSRDVLRAAGFVFAGKDADGDLRWERPLPRRRGAGVERFLDATGRIDRYPVKDADRLDLWRWVAERALPRGEVWTEKQINERLAALAPGGDVAVLRRHLVDAGLLERTRSGSEYARAEGSAG